MIKKTPKISIVIPVYNEEKDIEDCINSLKKQSYKKIEIIIVDDGSTDNTLEVLKKFKKIIIINGEHKGPGFSRNLGAQKANGEILIFIDADMTFEIDYLKNLIDPILKNLEIIGTTHELEIATNIQNNVSKLWGEIRVDYRNAKEDLPRIFRAIRKEKFLELGGFDPKYGYADDQTLWFKYKIKPTVAKDTICYHKNPENLKATYKQARWIGASWKERFLIFKVPIISHTSVLVLFLLIPIFIILKSISGKKAGFIDTLKFHFFKFYGYYRGIFRAVFLGINYR
ncbi:MAG: glycosyltransferase family A protein [Candidatus Nanoarchaeia archaeon]|nr:glycosyltransferase family A protein [Candidatus Nanoarchaeia archaeon]